jgi:hypothetical protein
MAVAKEEEIIDAKKYGWTAIAANRIAAGMEYTEE